MKKSGHKPANTREKGEKGKSVAEKEIYTRCSSYDVGIRGLRRKWQRILGGWARKGRANGGPGWVVRAADWIHQRRRVLRLWCNIYEKRIRGRS